MERIQAICSHESWRENFKQLQALEAERIFCRHTFEHFLDVARIAYIENLEKGLGLSKELIYAAALLHDIGRAVQYQDGIPHEEAGAVLAAAIMVDCGYEAGERESVTAAILGHRDPEIKNRDDLAGLLYRADKVSRICLFCPAEKECNWPKEKKNLTLTV